MMGSLDSCRLGPIRNNETDVFIDSRNAHHENDKKIQKYQWVTGGIKMGQKYKMKTEPMLEKLTAAGYLEWRDDKHFLTEKGKKAGGQFKTGRFGAYFLWPQELAL